MRSTSCLIVLALSGAFARADSIQLKRDDVIPVVMQTELTFSDTREGDTFRADVTDSRMLPIGTHIEGIVHRVVQKDGKRPAFMDIEFTEILLADGHRASLHATPIPLSKNYVMQDRDGRWQAKKGVSKDTVVLGATAGGLILGSMIHKPFEGAFLGALLGIIAGETDKEDVGDGNVVVARGSKVGARVEQDVTLQFDGRWDSRKPNDDPLGPYDKDGYNRDGYDRYGYDRKGHYDPKQDDTRYGNRGDDRGGDSAYDRYGYDRDGRYDPRYDTTRKSPVKDLPPPRGMEIRIEVNKKALRYLGDEKPYQDGWIVMVPLRSTAEQLGYVVSRDQSEGSYRIEDDSDVLVVEQGSRHYRLNRQEGELPSSLVVRDGVAYVPIDAFTAVTKGSVYINGTKYRSGA